MEYTLPKKGSIPRQQKTYTREFKLEAVQLVKSSGKPLSQVARDLLISYSASDPRLWMGIRSQLPSPLTARFTATGFAGQEGRNRRRWTKEPCNADQAAIRSHFTEINPFINTTSFCMTLLGKRTCMLWRHHHACRAHERELL